MTLYRETPCEHDHMESHYTCDHIGYPEYNQISHTDENCQCPGGSREEVTIDYEAMEERFKELWALPEIGGTEGGLHQALIGAFDAVLHTEKEPASTVKVQP